MLRTMSNRRMAGLFVATATWVGAAAGPTNRRSVTSSLLPTSWCTMARPPSCNVRSNNGAGARSAVECTAARITHACTVYSEH
jgi:hypothetical protein